MTKDWAYETRAGPNFGCQKRQHDAFIYLYHLLEKIPFICYLDDPWNG